MFVISDLHVGHHVYKKERLPMSTLTVGHDDHLQADIPSAMINRDSGAWHIATKAVLTSMIMLSKLFP